MNKRTMRGKNMLFLLLVLALLAAVAAAVRASGQAGRSAAAAERVRHRADSLRRLTETYGQLAAADSLFHAADYAAARAAYDSLAAVGSPLPAGLLDQRRTHLLRLARLGYELDTLRRRTARVVPLPAPRLPGLADLAPAPAPLAARPPAAVDSLTLALRQARAQVTDLQRRLRATTGPHYLTFPSREGNQTYYVGEIRAGQADGRGVALLSTGSRYEGEWRGNQKHGAGTFHWADGARYEGEYDNDRRSGQGTYHFPDGSVYVGGWRDDLRHGAGTLRNARGKVVAQGNWRADELERQPRKR